MARVGLLLLLLAACGSTASEPAPAHGPPSSPAPADEEAACIRRLLCNAPVCSCPDGYRCYLPCDDCRADCVPAASAQR